MGQDESQVGPGVEEGDSRDPEDIREEIGETREQMGETVEALAEKADVKAQAQQKKAELKAQAQQRAQDLKQAALQKKDELVGKAKQASPESASGGPGGIENAKVKAKENPLPLAVGGALVVGFLLGRRGR